jgi:hypothetical protein
MPGVDRSNSRCHRKVGTNCQIKGVRDQVLANPAITLDQLPFDRHGAAVKQKQSVKKEQPVKKKQPDFDFTKDDDEDEQPVKKTN